MRPLIAVIPSYQRPGPLEASVVGVRQYVQPDDLIVLDQAIPLGATEARRQLCAFAVEKHGSAIDVLMLDDDVRFHAETRPESFRSAAALITERPRTGLVQLPNRALPSGLPDRSVVLAYHALFLAGEMLAAGVTYDPREYGDDVTMSLIAFFAGWRSVVTGRACMRHHVTRRGVVGSIGGGVEASHRDGVPVVCELLPAWRDRGWLTYDEGERDGVKLPTPYSSIRITPAGRAVHAAALRRADTGPPEAS